MFVLQINRIGDNSGINRQKNSNQIPEDILKGSIEKAINSPVYSEDRVGNGNSIDLAGNSLNIEDYYNKDIVAFEENVESVTKGDVNGDGKVDMGDSTDLWLSISHLDMDHRGWLDKEDYRLLEEQLKRLSPDDKRPRLETLARMLSEGDMNNDGRVDQTDFLTLMEKVEIPPNHKKEDDLETIKLLSNSLLDTPQYVIGNRIPDIAFLGKILERYTNTEYDASKAQKLVEFFLVNKSDLTGDGKVDPQDVITFWQTPSNPPQDGRGDVSGDGKADESK